MTSLPRDDGKSISVARMKRKALLDEIALRHVAGRVTEMVLCDDDKDEDPVDKLCKDILDYISPTGKAFSVCMDFPKKPPLLDARGSSQFLAFSKQYKSKFDKFMKSYSRVGIYNKKDVLPTKTCPVAMPDDEDVLKWYKNFKRFDTVVDHSDHLFSNSPMEQTTEAWAETIRQEWRVLEERLPETIFVRAYESRMDLLRAVIIGAKGTPYQDGLFFFDLYFPRTYPLEPPLVRYHSGGLGINPHLFECGEVRLNLFRSPTHGNSTLWPSPNTDMLHFLVSIQVQVLDAHPLFHQPGFVESIPSEAAEYFSLLYNEDIQLKSFKTMAYIMSNPPKNFEAFVVGHFRNRVVDILRATNAYREGLQVPVDVGNEESFRIRDNVDSCMICLFGAFIGIRATGVFNFTPIGPIIGFGFFLELSRESASGPAAIFDGKALNDGLDAGIKADPDDVVNEGSKVTLSGLLQTTLSRPSPSVARDPLRSNKRKADSGESFNTCPVLNLSGFKNLLRC